METVSFARAMPAPELLPLEELADCAQAVVARDGRTILSYGAGGGYAPLREVIAGWHGVHPGRVLLTNGSLQAIDLITRALAPARTVMCEWPTYDQAYEVFLRAGAAVIVAEVDEQGINPDSAEAALVGQSPPAFLYLVPTFHNPTGTTLSAERRRRIADLSRRRQIPIIEDDPYALLRFDGEPVPTLFEQTQRTAVYMSSFSRVIAPGLRVGYAILGEQLAEELAASAADTYITPALIGQAVVHEFIERGCLEPHLERLNAGLRLRRDAMLGALSRHLGGASWVAPEGGYFVWVEMPVGTDMRAVLERAAGVTAVPGTTFMTTANYVRLAYGFASPDQIDAGIERLAAAV